MSNNFIIYSHGFGVKKDDRGLFTDIASFLPRFHHVMFDYNQFDEAHTTLTVTPLTEQAHMLREKVQEVKAANPHCTIDLMCHSQGCIVAAMAKPNDVRNVIFLAPPTNMQSVDKKIQYMQARTGTQVHKDGRIMYPRRDGSITIITPAYWESYKGIIPIYLYNELAEKTNIIIIRANQDEVLQDVNFSGLSNGVRIIDINADHNFTKSGRQRVKQLIVNNIGVS